MKFTPFACLLLWFGSATATSFKKQSASTPSPSPPHSQQFFYKGVNFFGFETQTRVVHMLWCRSLESHLDEIARIGFNAIRLPVSEDMIMEDWEQEYPQQGAVSPNFPESGMRSIEIMDRFFDLAEARNITIVLDIHRLYDSSQSPKPFIENTIYTFVRFMDAWVKILTRYKDRPNLTHVDVFNEFASDDWDDWKNLAQIAIHHIESVFPGRFSYYVEGVRWGGSLSGELDNPLTFTDPGMQDRVSFSVHKYWFSDESIVWDEAKLRDSWEYSFGFLGGNQVMVGEWGYISEDPKQKQWAEKFVRYLRDKNIRDTFFWSWNYDSGDTKGVLLDDCSTVNQDKVDLLHRLWSS
jgi:endoglucanase